MKSIIILYLKRALEALAEQDDAEVRGYIEDALAKLERKELKK